MFGAKAPPMRARSPSMEIEIPKLERGVRSGGTKEVTKSGLVGSEML